MKDRGIIAGIIAVLIVGLFCFVVAVLIFHVVPQANETAFNGLVTALVSIVSGVTGYFFGSSRSAEQRHPERPPVTTPLPRMPLPPGNDFHQREN